MKTNPIGVRFDKELMDKIIASGIATSPQKILNLYEQTYISALNQKIAENNLPENKQKILETRNPMTDFRPIETSNPYIITADKTKEGQMEILKQIHEVQKENIPKERDTILGRKLWNIEQEKKINSLRQLLK